MDILYKHIEELQSQLAVALSRECQLREELWKNSVKWQDVVFRVQSREVECRQALRSTKVSNGDFGMAVRIRFGSGAHVRYRNVTEIHYNYDSPLKDVMNKQVAFESEHHQTGCTFRVDEVVEFEVTMEREGATEFSEVVT